MKTCQGTGYFRQVQLRLLLCFISSVVFAASAYAFTAPNNITACYDCHGSPIIPNGTDIRPVDSTYRNITTGGFVGSHRKHIASPTTAAITCTPCHGPAPAIMNHRDGKIEMTLTNPGTYSKGTFFNQTSLPVLGTCSNILCHSATTTPAVSTPTWGVSAGCAACHATTPPTGAHTIHMTAPISAACGTCHTGATIGTSGGPGHGNNLIDVSLYSPTTVAKHAPGAYTATCSTACHNAAGTTAVATPSWGVIATCSTCHAASPSTGSHTSHLLHTNITCGSCHSGATAGTTGGPGHGDGNIDVAAGGYPTNRTKGSAFASCSNISCHSDPNPTPAFTGPSVTWGQNLNCNGCHGYPGAPTNATVSSTHGVVAAGSCNGCHTHVNPGGAYNTATFGNIQLHGNGSVEAQGNCDGCHGYQTGTWGVSPTINAGGVGAHEKHVVYLTTKRFTVTLNPLSDQFGSAAASWTNVCGVCHSGASHQASGVQVFPVNNPTYFFGTAGSTTYNGVPGTPATTTAKTCSNISCHYFLTPSW